MWYNTGRLPAKPGDLTSVICAVTPNEVTIQLVNTGVTNTTILPPGEHLGYLHTTLLPPGEHWVH